MTQIKRKHASAKHISRIIEVQVSWFNGWHASETAMQKSCEKAAKKILRYLERKPCKTK